MAQLSDILTFSRSTAARYVDQNGYVAAAAVDELRIDHDPATLERLGFLVEGASQNEFEHSEDFSATWYTIGASVVAASGIAPDGTATATLLREDALDSAHLFATTADLTTGEEYTCSVWIKAAGRSFAQIFASSGAMGAGIEIIGVDLTTGATIASAGVTAKAQQHRDGWWRVSLSGTAATTGSVTWQIRAEDSLTSSNGTYQGDGTSGILLWGAQLEAQAFATSYIPTTGAAATRGTDRAEVPAGSWFREDEYTFYIQARPHSDAVTGFAFSLNAPATGNYAAFRGLAGNFGPRVWSEGASMVSFSSGPMVAGQDTKTAFACRRDDFALSADGGAIQTDTLGEMPVGPDVLEVGRHISDAGCWHGHIRDLRFYPRRLSDAELQAITA